MSNHDIDILYITPLRATGIKEIIRACGAGKILTLTGVPEYVTDGVAIGIGIKGEKPRILINITSAKNEGSDFSSQLLKLAMVITEEEHSP